MRELLRLVAVLTASGLLLGSASTVAMAAPTTTSATVVQSGSLKATNVQKAKGKSQVKAKPSRTSNRRAPAKNSQEALARFLAPLPEAEANGMDVCQSGVVAYLRQAKSAKAILENYVDVNGGVEDFYAADPNGDGVYDVVLGVTRGRDGSTFAGYSLGITSWDPHPDPGNMPWGAASTLWSVGHLNKKKFVNCWHSDGADWDWSVPE